MMPEITGPAAALLAGVVTSLHCAGMCGPLACATCTSSCERTRSAAVLLYHGTRLSSYAAVGAVAGTLGARVSTALMGGATRGMAWVFILFFLAIVLGLDKRIRLPLPTGTLSRIFSAGGGNTPLRAIALGAFTPLLPCVPLYLVVAAAALAGSAVEGMILMTAFGLGTVPLILLMQNRLHALQRNWSPRTMDYIRRGLSLVSIVILVVRGTLTASGGCPMCQ